MSTDADIMLQKSLPLPRTHGGLHHTFPSFDDAIDFFFQCDKIPIFRTGNCVLGIFFWVFLIGIRRWLVMGMGGFGSGVWVRGGEGRGAWDESKARALADVFDLVFGGLDVLIDVEGFACEVVVVGTLLEFALGIQKTDGFGFQIVFGFQGTEFFSHGGLADFCTAGDCCDGRECWMVDEAFIERHQGAEIGQDAVFIMIDVVKVIEGLEITTA